MEDYFNYLNELRESGVTNMFGASDYLMDEFGIGKSEARKILAAWIKQY